MIAFSLLFSYAVIGVKNANRTSTDTIIGVFSSTSVALGIVILSYNSGFSKYSNYLVGDLLSISVSDIILLIVVLFVVLVVWLTIFNKLLVASINQSLARSRGINTRIVELIFTSLIAVIVAVSIRWVGLLIINSLLVLPAAAARNVARNARQYSAISVLTALVSGVSGLILSYYWDTASGATIVLAAAVFFLATFLARKRFG
jgi:zinc transport system permease protein